MPKQHAYLSASSSHRWLACPPSARLCVGINDSGSPYAHQGTAAHALCEYKVETLLGRRARDPTEDLDYYDTEMAECTDQYCAYVSEQLEEARQHCSDPLVLVEERLDFSRWVPEGFGTGDCVIIADDVLHIIDFKYGIGVLVDADHNPQLMCYALGALDAYDCLYDIQTIRLTIYQPRRANISTYELSRAELLQWAEEVLAPTAALAYNGEGEFRAGDHCQFCKVKASCRKRAEYNLELASYEFKEPALLDDAEIAAFLPRLGSLVSWAEDLKDYVLQRALRGISYPGYKLVEGKSNRRYVDENAVAEAVTQAGYDPYERKVLGITAMTSLLGRKRFNELLGDMITKPPGRPTLVPESDKRPAINTAMNDFNDDEGGNQK